MTFVCDIADGIEYLAVGKLAVLKVELVAECPDAGVGVVVGVLTHTVWETVLMEKESLCWWKNLSREI